MTVLVDTSVWIEYLRGSKGLVRDAFVRLLNDGDVGTTDAVLLEVLVGPTNEDAANRLADLLALGTLLHQESPVDAEGGAAIYRACRRNGFTPRSLLDCVIAAVAIRHDVPLLHRDGDFDVIARHTDLRVLTP